MKTIEEKAKEYSSQWITSARHQHEVDFIAGYNEAIRFRDPKEELPEYYKKVIVKYERDDLKIDHECVSLLADDDGTYFFGNYRFDIIIDFDKVIGWRPIE